METCPVDREALEGAKVNLYSILDQRYARFDSCLRNSIYCSRNREFLKHRGELMALNMLLTLTIIVCLVTPKVYRLFSWFVSNPGNKK